MLTIEQVKQLLNNPLLSDQEIEDIRDAFGRLAEIVFEKWRSERDEEIIN